MATKFTKLIDYKSTTAVGNALSNATTISLRDLNKNVAIVPSGSGIIDIVNDFEWNANYVSRAYPKLPKMFLTEREQIESSLISSYFYYSSNIMNIIGNTSIGANGGTNTVNQIIDKVGSFISKQAGYIQDGLGVDVREQDILGATSVRKFLQFFTGIYDELRELSQNDSRILGEYLKSYLGIYLTRETGFTYVLPYFQNQFQSATNSWNTTDRIGIALFDAVDAAASEFLPIVKPGAYIERPRFFDFQSNQGASVTVEFPLLNTVSESYKKNYEFLWLLAFQNKYYRESFASVRPPKIYTCQIPGVKYMPYSYISDLTIDFIGTRRLLTVETPRGTVEAPIPDAYKVSITVQSLLSDSANALVSDQFYKQIKTATI